MSRSLGIPDVVLEKLRTLEVEDYCISMGPEFACNRCTVIINKVLREHYGDKGSRIDVLTTVIKELSAE